VPFFAQWKGQLPAGKVYEQPVISLDILPTAIAAAGSQPGTDWQLDGVNLLPYFKGENAAAPHDHLCWRFGTQWAIRRAKEAGSGLRWGARRQGSRISESLRAASRLSSDRGETKDLLRRQPKGRRAQGLVRQVECAERSAAVGAQSESGQGEAEKGVASENHSREDTACGSRTLRGSWLVGLTSPGL
jgi:arylsulfatase A-like enzyme